LLISTLPVALSGEKTGELAMPLSLTAINHKQKLIPKADLFCWNWLKQFHPEENRSSEEVNTFFFKKNFLPALAYLKRNLGKGQAFCLGFIKKKRAYFF